MTVNVATFPPPREPCPADEDVDALAASTVPDEVMHRLIYAAGYCQEAEERLR